MPSRRRAPAPVEESDDENNHKTRVLNASRKIGALSPPVPAKEEVEQQDQEQEEQEEQQDHSAASFDHRNNLSSSDDDDDVAIVFNKDDDPELNDALFAADAVLHPESASNLLPSDVDPAVAMAWFTKRGQQLRQEKQRKNQEELAQRIIKAGQLAGQQSSEGNGPVDVDSVLTTPSPIDIDAVMDSIAQAQEEEAAVAAAAAQSTRNKSKSAFKDWEKTTRKDQQDETTQVVVAAAAAALAGAAAATGGIITMQQPEIDPPYSVDTDDEVSHISTATDVIANKSRSLARGTMPPPPATSLSEHSNSTHAKDNTAIPFTKTKSNTSSSSSGGGGDTEATPPAIHNNKNIKFASFGKATATAANAIESDVESNVAGVALNQEQPPPGEAAANVNHRRRRTSVGSWFAPGGMLDYQSRNGKIVWALLITFFLAVIVIVVSAVMATQRNNERSVSVAANQNGGSGGGGGIDLTPTTTTTKAPTVSPTIAKAVIPTKSPTLNDDNGDNGDGDSVINTPSPTSIQILGTPSPSITTEEPKMTVSPTTATTTTIDEDHEQPEPTLKPTSKDEEITLDTKSPEKEKTVSPTRSPTVSPTLSPTRSPTRSPTSLEATTMAPTTIDATPPRRTVSPTTISPTVSPTKSPTVSPTRSPTVSPTISPTKSPTPSPTVSPTKSPTVSPTISPTPSPTRSPTTISPTTKGPTAPPTPLSVWFVPSTIIEGDTIGDSFGATVSMSTNGNVVAAGSPDATVAGELQRAGKVTVYARSSDTATWQHRATFFGTFSQGTFGSDVALNDDGSVLAIGEPLGGTDRLGRVRTYRFNTGSGEYEQIGTELFGETATSYFGVTIGLSPSGDYLVVGAPLHSTDRLRFQGTVYVYKWTGGDWELVGDPLSGSSTNDWLGSAVAVHQDSFTGAVTVAASATNESSGGYVRVWQLGMNGKNTEWQQLGADLTNENLSALSSGYRAQSEDRFGNSISLSRRNVGSDPRASFSALTVAIGVPQKSDSQKRLERMGMTIVYQFITSNTRDNRQSQWTMLGDPLVEENQSGDEAGYSVQLYQYDPFSNNAMLLAVGAPGYRQGRGTVRLYEYDIDSETSWRQVDGSVGALMGSSAGEDFGVAVSLSFSRGMVRIAVGALEATIGAAGYVAVLEG